MGNGRVVLIWGLLALGLTLALYGLSRQRSAGAEERVAVEREVGDTKIKRLGAPAVRPRRGALADEGTTKGKAAAPVRVEERERRIAELANDLATSRPEVVRADGETSGRISFNVEVVNESGVPVEGATVEMTGMRTTGVTRVNWYGWRGGEMKVMTNAKGLARVSAIEFVDERMPLGGVTFNVSHPDYASQSADMHLDEFKKVVLKTGWNFDVVVTDEESSRPLRGDLDFQFNGRFKPEWSQQPSGVINVRNISDKALEFYVSRNESGTTATSDFTSVTLPRETKEPVYVALHRTYTVKGRLSDNVPRPVKNGKVEAARASTENACGRYLTREVDIRPDGTFELENMTRGKIWIWALADGWCSEIPADAESKSMGAPQSFELTAETKEYVLPMVQTATAIFHLVQQDGQPAGGAIVSTSPNMCREGCCGMWIRSEEFRTTSTIDGVAVLADLPPLTSARFGVGGEYELLPRPAKSWEGALTRDLNFDLQPGQVLEQTVTVYPRGYMLVKDDGDKMTTAPGPAYTGP